MRYTITRALSELKALDAKISRPAAFGSFAAVLTGDAQKVETVYYDDTPAGTASEIASKIQGSIDSLKAAIDRRRKIKAALIQSNAMTYVVVGGHSMTVAEAIELKTHINTLSTAADFVKSAVVAANRDVARLDREMEAMIDSQIKTLLGAQGSAALSANGMQEQIAAPIRSQKKPSAMTDKAVAFVEEHETLAEAVRNELDYVLSESNAITTIDIY